MEYQVQKDYRVSHEKLFEVWRKNEKGSKIYGLEQYMLVDVMDGKFSDEDERKVKDHVKSLEALISRNWEQGGQCESNVRKIKHFSDWLTRYYHFQSDDSSLPSTSCQQGCSKKKFKDMVKRNKRDGASKLSEDTDHNVAKLLPASAVAAKSSGEKDSSKVSKKVTASPKRPCKAKEKNEDNTPKPIPFSKEEALAFIIELRFNKSQYLAIRSTAKACNAHIYPSYNNILKAKTESQVSPLEVTDTVVKVPLRSLVEHTIKRIAIVQAEVLDTFMEFKCANPNDANAVMIFSCGFDETSGQVNYNQQFQDSTEISAGSDSSLFATTVVPLRLVSESGVILWINKTPQSVRFCRPLKLQFAKTNEQLALVEKNYLDAEMGTLQKITITTGENKCITVEPQMKITLIDGKVLDYLTETRSTQACPVCYATPVDFRDIKDFESSKFSPQHSSFQFGISPWHAWIRFFECILHLAYKEGIEWRITSAKDKEIMKENKKRVQDLFWQKMSLRVDEPKSGGAGSTNSGYTAQKAFGDPELFAQITNVDIELIEHLRDILVTISCKFSVSSRKFREYCFETARIYQSLYPTKPMTATLHKVLIHGSQIMLNSTLPMAPFGEDEAESDDEFNFQDRLFYGRKDTRIHDFADTFNRAMASSDPVLSSQSLCDRLRLKNYKTLPKAVIELLEIPEQSVSDRDSEEESSDSETELDDMNLELGDHFLEFELDAEDIVM